MTENKGVSTRVGVVGVGKMGHYHLQKMRALPNVQVVGVFDPHAERAEQAVSEGGLVFGSLNELLFEVDAAVVAAPTAHHAAITRAALDAGVHVLVEKPMTAELAEAEQLVELAARSNLVLQVGMVERFRLQALVAEGLGPVEFIETQRLSSQLPRDPDIDVVSDLLIHDVDLVLALVGAPPTRVLAWGASRVSRVCDTVQARLEFESGVVAHLHASRIYPGRERSLRVFSKTEGYRHFDWDTNQVRSLDTHPELPKSVDPLQEQARHFIHCIQNGEPPLVGPKEALMAQQITSRILAELNALGHVPAAATAVERSLEWKS